MSLDKILENYNHDKEYGYLINKKTGEYYCKNCLYENLKEVPLYKYGNIWKCNIVNCKTEYKKYESFNHETKPINHNPPLTKGMLNMDF